MENQKETTDEQSKFERIYSELVAGMNSSDEAESNAYVDAMLAATRGFTANRNNKPQVSNVKRALLELGKSTIGNWANVAQMHNNVGVLERRIDALETAIASLATNEILVETIASKAALKIITDFDNWQAAAHVYENAQVHKELQPNSLEVYRKGETTYEFLALDSEGERKTISINHLPDILASVLTPILIRESVSTAKGESIWITYPGSEELVDCIPEDYVPEEEKVLSELAEGKSPDDDETYDDPEILSLVEDLEVEGLDNILETPTDE